MISTRLFNRDRVLDAFTDAYNKMQQCYDDDEFDDCVDMGEKLLADSALSPYHRMRTLALLSSFSDLEDAQRYHAEAEALWRIIRGSSGPGFRVVDDDLTRTHAGLVDIVEALRTERAKKLAKKGKGKGKGKAGQNPVQEYDHEAAVQAQIARHEKVEFVFNDAVDDEVEIVVVDRETWEREKAAREYGCGGDRGKGAETDQWTAPTSPDGIREWFSADEAFVDGLQISADQKENMRRIIARYQDAIRGGRDG
jgi:hypothetical protein